MYGHLNVIIKSFLEEKYNVDALRAVFKKACCALDVDQHKVYDDQDSERLIQAATSYLSLERDEFLERLGQHYLEFLRRSGHDEFLRNLADNMLAFVENLDYAHTYMMGEFPDINMPSFRCESDSQSDKMRVHYLSFRKDLEYLVIGILRAAARVYLKSNLQICVEEKDMDDVGPQLGMRQHVVFSITVTKITEQVVEGTPTYVAQTKKHGEKQILKRDIDRVVSRLEQIRREFGEEALPLNRTRVAQSKWKALAKMSVLFGGFVPQYPVTLSLDARTFCRAFPYHVLMNEAMRVVHSGIKIQQLMPGLRSLSAEVPEFFDLLHPHSMTFNFENVSKFINTPFVMKTKKTKMASSWGKKPMVVLRGQMMRLADKAMIIYLCSPFVRCLGDLEERSMHMSDIPIHDVTRDLLWIELMNRYRRAKRGSIDVTRSGGSHVVVPDSPLQHFDQNDPEVLRAELARVNAQLEHERAQNQRLYQAFLPESTAAMIRKGHRPKAGMYRDVSVLFSDIVSFAAIVARCGPDDVINLITQLHNKFDDVCRAHNVYRVDAVADAYMVVSGLPDPSPTHAESIANTALGMLLSARDVASPYDYGDKTKHVKIRIGIHSGRVVSGVVGDDVPRLLVMGDAVNVAARMESHGVPDRVHITDVTHKLLKQKGYLVEKRGEIEVRGRGTMTTYFLLANERVPQSALIGQDNEVTFINEGRVQTPPPVTRNNTGSRSPFLRSNSGSRSPFLSNKVSPSVGQRSESSISRENSDAHRRPLILPGHVSATGNASYNDTRL